ncbi:MAG TPA: amylo-alpha-1,6-glucosidase [Candidatus Acidoferrales bacterium]|nr:amylo-alpha-1,6-glucosidase [Candidatus Acidoferrales bacterium]
MITKAERAAAERGGPSTFGAFGGMPAIDFGREICGSLSAAEQREWLVTNSLGGFASGTVAGLITRRYHGLLVAALKPPLARTLLVSKIDETATYNGQVYALATNRWRGGALDPQGYRLIERFRLEGTTPVWTFACGDALVEKRVWMQPGANTTYVCYELLRGSGALDLALKVLVNYRDYHATTRAGDPGSEWRMRIEPILHGLRVVAFDGATPFYLLSAAAGSEQVAGEAEPAHIWYRNFDLAVERSRGLEDQEDHLLAGTFRARLWPGESLTLVLSTEPRPGVEGHLAWGARVAAENNLLDRWSSTHPRAAADAPAWIRQLVLAADQFIVSRALKEEAEARTVVAGYHWFYDWGRDTMIALPGLTLETGRAEDARKILRTFARFVDRGMLPNVFPEYGEAPAYNTVDAALWYFEAVRQYQAATRDTELLDELFSLLAEIVDWHVRGTRYNVSVDPADGLLYAGEPGTPLTWMDARVDGRAVTPRIGKPVEVNALWLNALIAMTQFARTLNRPSVFYEWMARRVTDSFRRFWNAASGYCFDVIDGPDGNDGSLRPNQIFAVSLSESPLSPEQQRAVVDACARHLLTPHGLRSLAREHPDYRGQYGGPPGERDAAYHQGTVWGWLLGPFAVAHMKVYADPARATTYLEAIAGQEQAYGLGSLGEIFDGEAPFAPRGCVAQAWTVAEVLRAWLACWERSAAP